MFSRQTYISLNAKNGVILVISRSRRKLFLTDPSFELILSLPETASRSKLLLLTDPYPGVSLGIIIFSIRHIFISCDMKWIYIYHVLQAEMNCLS